MRRIFALLCDSDQSIANYVWKAWSIAFIPSLAISAIVTLGLELPGNRGPIPIEHLVKAPTDETSSFARPQPGSEDNMGPATLSQCLFWAFLALIVGPWGETVLMWPLLSFMEEYFQRTLWAASASALVWGYFHSQFAVGWGLTVVWPFFVFSVCFLTWKKKSTRRAIVVTGLVHTCQNLVPVVIEITFCLCMRPY